MLHLITFLDRIELCLSLRCQSRYLENEYKIFQVPVSRAEHKQVFSVLQTALNIEL